MLERRTNSTVTKREFSKNSIAEVDSTNDEVTQKLDPWYQER